MDNEKNLCECHGERCKDKCRCGHRSVCGGSYGLGFVGAVIYYFHGVTTFWTGVIAILKAAVWPAFLVYHLFAFLKM